MPTIIPRVIGVISAIVDRQTKDVVLTMKTEGESSIELRVLPGVVGGLAIALFKLGAAIAPSANAAEATVQVMHLNGVRPAVGPQGQPILELILESGLHLPVTFPTQAIPALQSALVQLAKNAKPQPDTAAH